MYTDTCERWNVFGQWWLVCRHCGIAAPQFHARFYF